MIHELGIISTSETKIITPAEKPRPTDRVLRLSFCHKCNSTADLRELIPANIVRLNANPILFGMFITKSFCSVYIITKETFLTLNK